MFTEKIRILLIEDNETDAILVQSDLQQAMGAQVEIVHVERLDTALELLREEPFDLILSDLSLPDSDGIETIHRLRENAGNVPIAVLSFRNDEKLAIRVIKAGAQDYLVKGSLTEGVLARVIRYSIERKRVDEGIRKAQHRFQTIFEKAPLGIALINLQTGEYYDVNPRYASITGRNADELLRCRQSDIIYPDDLSSYHIDIASFINRKSQNCKIISRIVCPDPSVIWVKMSIVPFEIIENREISYLCMIEDITEHKQMVENLHQLTAYLQDVREEERTRIGREIHDVLGGTLAVLKMDLGWLANKINEQSTRERVESLYQLTGEAIETARRVSVNLRPSVLDNLGLCGAVEWLVREFEQRTNIQCTLTMPPGLSIINKNYETSIFRIIQEVFVNITRHAEATTVDIEFSGSDNDMIITIRDNGIGITESQILNPGSFGIIGMNERIRQLGGKLEIHGAPSKGSTVILKIPSTLISLVEEPIYD